MSAIDKALSDISDADIRRLLDEKPAKGAQFEIKAGLPGKQAGSSDLSEYARNNLAAEIVAFANTFGGTLVIGIEETDDKPHRPNSISALPECADLARRLRQAIFDVIDPPLSRLESHGVVTEADGHSGVVLMRVDSSRRAPHRLISNKEVYVRREDETARIAMREIQELTLRRLTELRQIENAIREARDRFLTEAKASQATWGLHWFAIPTSAEFLSVATRPPFYGRH